MGDIASHLEENGKIKPKSILINKNGYGQWAKIEFDSTEKADETVKNLNLSKLKGKEVEVDWCIRKKWKWLKVKDIREIKKLADKMKVDGPSGRHKLNKQKKR